MGVGIAQPKCLHCADKDKRIEELESLIDRAIDALHDDFPSRMSKAERILRKEREEL